MISEDSSSFTSLAIKLAVSLDTKTASVEFVSHINKTDYILQFLASYLPILAFFLIFPNECVVLREKVWSCFASGVVISYLAKVYRISGLKKCDCLLNFNPKV